MRPAGATNSLSVSPSVARRISSSINARHGGARSLGDTPLSPSEPADMATLRPAEFEKKLKYLQQSVNRLYQRGEVTSDLDLDYVHGLEREIQELAGELASAGAETRYSYVGPLERLAEEVFKISDSATRGERAAVLAAGVRIGASVDDAGLNRFSEVFLEGVLDTARREFSGMLDEKASDLRSELGALLEEETVGRNRAVASLNVALQSLKSGLEKSVTGMVKGDEQAMSGIAEIRSAIDNEALERARGDKRIETCISEIRASLEADDGLSQRLQGVAAESQNLTKAMGSLQNDVEVCSQQINQIRQEFEAEARLRSEADEKVDNLLVEVKSMCTKTAKDIKALEAAPAQFQTFGSALVKEVQQRMQRDDEVLQRIQSLTTDQENFMQATTGLEKQLSQMLGKIREDLERESECRSATDDQIREMVAGISAANPEDVQRLKEAQKLILKEKEETSSEMLDAIAALRADLDSSKQQGYRESRVLEQQEHRVHELTDATARFEEMFSCMEERAQEKRVSDATQLGNVMSATTESISLLLKNQVEDAVASAREDIETQKALVDARTAALLQEFQILQEAHEHFLRKREQSSSEALNAIQAFRCELKRDASEYEQQVRSLGNRVEDVAQGLVRVEAQAMVMFEEVVANLEQRWEQRWQKAESRDEDFKAQNALMDARTTTIFQNVRSLEESQEQKLKEEEEIASQIRAAIVVLRADLDSCKQQSDLESTEHEQQIRVLDQQEHRVQELTNRVARFEEQRAQDVSDLSQQAQHIDATTESINMLENQLKDHVEKVVAVARDQWQTARTEDVEAQRAFVDAKTTAVLHDVQTLQEAHEQMLRERLAKASVWKNGKRLMDQSQVQVALPSKSSDEPLVSVPSDVLAVELEPMMRFIENLAGDVNRLSLAQNRDEARLNRLAEQTKTDLDSFRASVRETIEQSMSISTASHLREQLESCNQEMKKLSDQCQEASAEGKAAAVAWGTSTAAATEAIEHDAITGGTIRQDLKEFLDIERDRRASLIKESARVTLEALRCEARDASSTVAEQEFAAITMDGIRSGRYFENEVYDWLKVRLEEELAMSRQEIVAIREQAQRATALAISADELQSIRFGAMTDTLSGQTFTEQVSSLKAELHGHLEEQVDFWKTSFEMCHNEIMRVSEECKEASTEARAAWDNSRLESGNLADIETDANFTRSSASLMKALLEEQLDICHQKMLQLSQECLEATSQTQEVAAALQSFKKESAGSFDDLRHALDMSGASAGHASEETVHALIRREIGAQLGRRNHDLATLNEDHEKVSAEVKNMKSALQTFRKESRRKNQELQNELDTVLEYVTKKKEGVPADSSSEQMMRTLIRQEVDGQLTKIDQELGQLSEQCDQTSAGVDSAKVALQRFRREADERLGEVHELVASMSPLRSEHDSNGRRPSQELRKVESLIEEDFNSVLSIRAEDLGGSSSGVDVEVAQQMEAFVQMEVGRQATSVLPQLSRISMQLRQHLEAETARVSRDMEVLRQTLDKAASTYCEKHELAKHKEVVLSPIIDLGKKVEKLDTRLQSLEWIVTEGNFKDGLPDEIKSSMRRTAGASRSSFERLREAFDEELEERQISEMSSILDNRNLRDELNSFKDSLSSMKQLEARLLSLETAVEGTVKASDEHLSYERQTSHDLATLSDQYTQTIARLDQILNDGAASEARSRQNFSSHMADVSSMMLECNEWVNKLSNDSKAIAAKLDAYRVDACQEQSGIQNCLDGIAVRFDALETNLSAEIAHSKEEITSLRMENEQLQLQWKAESLPRREDSREMEQEHALEVASRRVLFRKEDEGLEKVQSPVSRRAESPSSAEHALEVASRRVLFRKEDEGLEKVQSPVSRRAESPSSAEHASEVESRRVLLKKEDGGLDKVQSPVSRRAESPSSADMARRATVRCTNASCLALNMINPDGPAIVQCGACGEDIEFDLAARVDRSELQQVRLEQRINELTGLIKGFGEEAQTREARSDQLHERVRILQATLTQEQDSLRSSLSDLEKKQKAAAVSSEEVEVGLYEITRAAIVKESFETDSTRVADLFPNDFVNVVEVQDLEDRVRARIEEPPGWISVLNKNTGARYAVKVTTSRSPERSPKKNARALLSPKGLPAIDEQPVLRACEEEKEVVCEVGQYQKNDEAFTSRFTKLETEVPQLSGKMQDLKKSCEADAQIVGDSLRALLEAVSHERKDREQGESQLRAALMEKHESDVQARCIYEERLSQSIHSLREEVASLRATSEKQSPSASEFDAKMKELLPVLEEFARRSALSDSAGNDDSETIARQSKEPTEESAVKRTNARKATRVRKPIAIDDAGSSAAEESHDPVKSRHTIVEAQTLLSELADKEATAEDECDATGITREALLSIVQSRVQTFEMQMIARLEKETAGLRSDLKDMSSQAKLTVSQEMKLMEDRVEQLEHTNEIIEKHINGLDAQTKVLEALREKEEKDDSLATLNDSIPRDLRIMQDRIGELYEVSSAIAKEMDAVRAESKDFKDDTSCEFRQYQERIGKLEGKPANEKQMDAVESDKSDKSNERGISEKLSLALEESQSKWVRLEAEVETLRTVWEGASPEASRGELQKEILALKEGLKSMQQRMEEQSRVEAYETQPPTSTGEKARVNTVEGPPKDWEAQKMEKFNQIRELIQAFIEKEIGSFKSTSKDLENRIKEMTLAFEDAKSKSKSLDGDVSGLQALREEVKELTGQMEELARICEESHLQCKELEEKFASSSGTLMATTQVGDMSGLQSLKTEVKELAGQMGELAQLGEENKMQCQDLGEKLSFSNGKIKDLVSELEELARTSEEGRLQLEEKVVSLNGAVSNGAPGITNASDLDSIRNEIKTNKEKLERDLEEMATMCEENRIEFQQQIEALTKP